jgi:large subunit ribosomal protein L6
MSRVGKKIIEIPSGVEVKIDGNHILVKGPKGELDRVVNSVVTLKLDDADGVKQVSASVVNEENHKERAQWGTARALVSNMVIGVTDGFTKELEVNGVGYKVNMQGNTVVLNVGYSHEVRYELPEGIEGVVEGNKIIIKGRDKQVVGEVAANIRKVRKPEPYKGKGIKYVDEIIRRKAGKAQKTGE